MTVAPLAAAMQIRPALSEDAPRLARLAAHAGTRWSEADFAGSLGGTARGWVVEAAPAAPLPADPLLAAALRPALAAAILVQPAPDDWEVLDLAVAPACRRQGLAKWLLAQAGAAARAGGAQRLLLEVREGNARARAVYVAAGFAQIARRPGYYAAGADRPIEDAIVMAQLL
ncbi:MAG: GNAT family N-acetyltransferase [Rhodocyclaceae bacterium]|nr:GNAT family N-acetyltransferase [Rhodocyclaceae bacterium]